GERAQAMYAPRAAIEHFSRALDAALALALPPDPALYRARGLAWETVGNFDAARLDHVAALAAAEATDDRRGRWQAPLDLGFLWASRDYGRAGDHIQRALELARSMEDPAALARSLNWVGNWQVNAGRPWEGVALHQEALAIAEHLGD